MIGSEQSYSKLACGVARTAKRYLTITTTLYVYLEEKLNLCNSAFLSRE